MKKITFLLTLALGLFSLSKVSAQAGTYGFAASSGTFTPLTGATAVASIQADGVLSAPIPIGFTFNFDSGSFTDLKASSDGYISFGTSTANTITNDLSGTLAARRPLIAPLWDDLDGRATGGSTASYLVSGVAPNRVFTFEWLNWEWNWSSSSPVVSFQVKLYETTDVIEFVYRKETGTPSSPSASIGLSGVSSFLSLDGTGANPTASNVTESKLLATVPANGQVYTFTPPTCPIPKSIVLNNLTATGVDVNWTSSAPNWNVEYGPTGFTPGTGTFVPNAANPFNLTGLTPETGYDVYVQDVCAIADLSAWVKTSFTTTCLAVSTFPWSEDFESVTTPNLPSCWSELNNNADTDFFKTFTSNGSGNSKSVGLYTDYNSGNNDDYLILPRFTLTGNERLLFSVRTGNTTEPDEFKVVLSTTGTNAADFSTDLMPTTTVANITQTPIAPIDLSAYSGDVYIAIHIPSGSTDGWYIYFDDFLVEEIPSCIAPTALTATAITDTDATLGWTPGGASNWNIEYGPAGFTPGTGTLETNVLNPFVLTGLSANTDYEFYVQDDCGSGDVSAWVGPTSFTTECAAIVPAHLEDFTSMTSSVVPNCWKEARGGSVSTGPSSFGASDWASDGFLNSGATGAASINLYSNTDKEWLISPEFDLSGTAWELSIDFGVTAWLGTSSRDMGSDDEVILLASEDNGVTWDTLEIFNAANNPSNTGINKKYNLSAYTGNVKFAIWATDGSVDDSEDYNFYVDNFDIHVLPSCPMPSNLISTYSAMDSVVLNWTAGAGETAWNIEYGPVGFTPGTGTLVSSTATTDTIAGLSLGSFFDFYVQADCGSGDLSAWTGPVSVGTAITNDSTCNAILVLPNSDLSSRLFSNIGATTQPNEAAKLPGSRTHNNTVWFKTVVPASGHLIIATCFSDFNSILGVYAADTAICDSLETFREVGYSSTNSTICGVSNRGTLQFCDQTPGDTLIFYVGGSTASQSGIIDLIVSDWGVEGLAGQAQATPVTVCAGDTLNMFDYLTGQETNDIAWEYPSNPNAIINDSLINTGAMTLTGNEVYYIYRGNCNSDTATVVINASRQSNTGTAVSSFQACSNGDVFLFEGLTGTVDAGGTWSDDTNTGLVNGNKFVANGLPNGPYQFTYTVGNNVCAPASTQITVNLVDCTNITEGESTTFGIYPNPNNGTFFITNGKNDNNIEMEVLDVQGKVIYSNTYSLAAGSQQEVSLGNVESGVYLIRVITNNQVFNSSVIVK